MTPAAPAPTGAQLAAGAAALLAYVDAMLEARGMGWAEWLVPRDKLTAGATAAIEAAFAAKDQSAAGRQAAAVAALEADADAHGYASDFTPAQAAEAAAAILKATVAAPST